LIFSGTLTLPSGTAMVLIDTFHRAGISNRKQPAKKFTHFMLFASAGKGNRYAKQIHSLLSSGGVDGCREVFRFKKQR
jgi:hypothetical protein